MGVVPSQLVHLVRVADSIFEAPPSLVEFSLPMSLIMGK